MPFEMHTCTTCFKSFSRRGDLTRHANIHLGYRPHKCSDCGKCFSQYSGLKTHMNVHTRVKPYTCEIDGCTAAFGDPSSRARHCKEKHRTVGAYRCPAPHCKSSIKRRSAFIQHLKKHNINPDSIDVDALAPVLIPRLAPYQRKFAQGDQAQPSDPPVAQVVTDLPLDLNIIVRDGAFYHQDDGSSGPVLRPVPEVTGIRGPAYSIDGSWHPGPIEIPAVPGTGLFTINVPSPPSVFPTDGLLTFDSPSPHHTGDSHMDSPRLNPGLSYSASPSPSPPQQSLVQLPVHYGSRSRPSTPSPLALQPQSSLLFFSPDPYVASSDGQKSTAVWDFEASIFAPSHEEFNGIRV